ncbi:MAG TPA: hypothetical protein P5080_06005 [Candidatus Paceibacterota bacterium]|nr:hypothetical protein [Candidatus Pacearchaeota archaeon]HRZ51478.1 hypothetical protein [Candidatus Paceibacterota bacterium]HSA37220.1 hypothetical protein [Candidatus Paceibacterota bacterium]
MPGLCPRCGRVYCDDTAEERGQSEAEFWEDMRRDITPEELEAWESQDDAKKIAAAQAIAAQRKAGTFVPTFNHAERALHMLNA